MITFAPLPPGIKPDRDPTFTSREEATLVAQNLEGDHGMKNPEIPITVVAVIPPVPNTNEDGRICYFVKFTRQEDQLNELGRIQQQPVEYNMNCGLLLDFATLQAGLPWKYNATKEQRPNSSEMFWMGAAKK